MFPSESRLFVCGKLAKERLRFLLFAALMGFCFSTAVILPAQELGYSGVGAIDHSIAGATASLPLDGSGAMYWNPATIGDLDFAEVQFGVGRTNAPWYGDETVIGAIIIPLAVILWAFNDDDDDNNDNNYEDYIPKPKETTSTDLNNNYSLSYPTSYPMVRGINFSFVMPATKDRHWNFGLAIAETGSRKIRFFTDTDNIVRGKQYRVKATELTPTFSWRYGKRFQFGFSPILSLTEFPEASYPLLPGFERNAESEHAAFGIQLGAYYRTKNHFNFGLSVRTPHWTSAQCVQWFNNNSDIFERKLHYSTEYPMRYVLGMSYTGFERLKLAFDVRLYDFQHLSSFYSVTGHSAPKRVTSCAAGLQFTPGPSELPLVFRLGYQFNDSQISYDDYYFNSTPPIAGGHSIHYGISIGKREGNALEVSFSLSHSFGDKGPGLQTVSGTRFKYHPNNNAFWWNVRYKF